VDHQHGCAAAHDPRRRRRADAAAGTRRTQTRGSDWIRADTVRDEFPYFVGKTWPEAVSLGVVQHAFLSTHNPSVLGSSPSRPTRSARHDTSSTRRKPRPRTTGDTDRPGGAAARSSRPHRRCRAAWCGADYGLQARSRRPVADPGAAARTTHQDPYPTAPRSPRRHPRPRPTVNSRQQFGKRPGATRTALADRFPVSRFAAP